MGIPGATSLETEGAESQQCAPQSSDGSYSNISRGFTEPLRAAISNSFGSSLKRLQRVSQTMVYNRAGFLKKNTEAFKKAGNVGIFDVYDKDHSGILSYSQMSLMLQDFHRSCGINVDLAEELEIVRSLKTTAGCIHEDRCDRCGGLEQFCRSCFIELITFEDQNLIREGHTSAETTVKSVAPVKGAEFQYPVTYGTISVIQDRMIAILRSSQLQWTSFMILYLGISAGIAYLVMMPVVYNELLFSLYGVAIAFARSGAALIIVGTTFILLSVNKLFLDLLFRTLSSVLYLHMSMLNLHKVVAFIVLAAALMHSISWLVTFAQLGNNSGWINYDPEYADFPDFGAQCRSAGCLYAGYIAITGYCMLFILFLLYAISTQRAVLWLTRKAPWMKRHVENFSFYYWAHIFMAVSFVGILLFHPLPGLPSTTELGKSIAWIFFAIPILLFLIRIIVAIVNLHAGKTFIEHVEALPGQVCFLQCASPKSAEKAVAGDYATILIPCVHVRERHPFTLSGYPENGTLQFHIKVIGDWTAKLYELAKAGSLQSQRIIISGVYTTRTAEYDNFKVIVMISTGIGATPFTSLIHKAVIEGASQEKTYYFHWMVREHVAAQTWFHDLFQSIETLKGIKIKVMVWYTGAKSMKNKNPSLTRLFDLTSCAYQEISGGLDLITGIKVDQGNVRAGIGRPVWSKIFPNIAEQHDADGDIGVFYCGSEVLRQQLRRLCSQYSTQSTSFKLHAEEFNSW